MHVLSIISHKGGSGKTSSAVMLAEDLAQLGLQVLLIDADRQNSAGLLLGMEQITGGVTYTTVPRLRYLSGTQWSLQELPARLEELRGRFDALVVDTPSLDDPLARSWLCLSTAALLVVPVEPLSIWTLPAAETELAELRAQSNPELKLLGVLPTLYDVDHLKQRRLLQELTEPRSERVLSPPIPWDTHLAQRGAQREERQPRRETRMAYRAVSDTIFRALGLQTPAGKKSRSLPELPSAPGRPARLPAPAATAVSTRTIIWGVCAVLMVAMLMVAVLGFWLARTRNPGAAGTGGRAAVASTEKDRR